MQTLLVSPFSLADFSFLFITARYITNTTSVDIQVGQTEVTYYLQYKLG